MPNSIYSSINSEDILYFKNITDDKSVLYDEENLKIYGHDETEDLQFNPEVVLKPKNTSEISNILKYCNERKIPVTVRGAGTGLSGGALPVCKGVILSTERLNKIIEIDERNLQATVETGVVTEVFQNAEKEKGLFYPPDPSSKGSCFLGGNLGESSGGPKAVKYGVTKDYVLNLEVVLANGDVIWTGANVLKNATGYNLTQLLIGSEGTLGIITKIVFKLIPHPTTDLLMLVPFKKMEQAAEAVSDIFRAGITPSAMEFLERDAIEWTLKYVDASVPLSDDDKAHLLIEVDGNDQETLFKDCEKINEVLDKYDIGEVYFADSADQKEELWKVRRRVGEAVKSHSVYKEEDTVVPRAELPILLKGVKEIGTKYGFKSVCYGHAGDGNLHINIVKDGMTDQQWGEELPKGITEIFELCKELKGTISGEHGIGLVQKNYMSIVFSKVELELMKGIKNVFDPNGILNPSKIFPDN